MLDDQKAECSWLFEMIEEKQMVLYKNLWMQMLGVSMSLTVDGPMVHE